MSELQQQKSIKEKTLEELQAEADAMHNYKQEQTDILARGQAAEAELAQRLGQELNIKAGVDLKLERLLNEALNLAARRQMPAEKDVVLLAITIDNTHAAEPSQRLNEAAIQALLRTTLDEHLPGGAVVSAVGLQATGMNMLQQYRNAANHFIGALNQHNKAKAAEIQRKYKHPFVFNPKRFVPED